MSNEAAELSTEEWKQRKKEKKAQMAAMQALPYEVKVKRAELRAREFVEKLDDMGLKAHVSVGGLDSIVLLLFLREIGIDVPAISVSSLEDKSIQQIHRDLGVIRIASGKPKVQILQEYGFPVISKKIAGRIDTLQNPTEKNKTVRHAIITGECGAQRTGCSMCGFGVHMEQRPHRFDKLRERNPKEWEFWMYRCCRDPQTGEKYGWGRVLDYIGVPWEDDWRSSSEIKGQMSFWDFPEILPRELQENERANKIK